MSRIQAAYDVLARKLRESEKPAVEAFEAKYAHAANPHGPGMPPTARNEVVAEYHLAFASHPDRAEYYVVNVNGSFTDPRARSGSGWYGSYGTLRINTTESSPGSSSFANDPSLESEPYWKVR